MEMPIYKKSFHKGFIFLQSATSEFGSKSAPIIVADRETVTYRYTNLITLTLRTFVFTPRQCEMV